ncbi:hypothetical protein [Halochromatium sp.]
MNDLSSTANSQSACGLAITPAPTGKIRGFVVILIAPMPLLGNDEMA